MEVVGEASSQVLSRQKVGARPSWARRGRARPRWPRHPQQQGKRRGKLGSHQQTGQDNQRERGDAIEIDNQEPEPAVGDPNHMATARGQQGLKTASDILLRSEITDQAIMGDGSQSPPHSTRRTPFTSGVIGSSGPGTRERPTSDARKEAVRTFSTDKRASCRSKSEAGASNKSAWVTREPTL